MEGPSVPAIRRPTHHTGLAGAGGHYQRAVLWVPCFPGKAKARLSHPESDLSVATLGTGIACCPPAWGAPDGTTQRTPTTCPGAREGESHMQASPWPSAPCMTLHKPLCLLSLSFPICNTRGTTLVQALPRGPKEQPQQVSGDEKPRRREPPARSLSRVWPPLLGYVGRQLKGEPGPHPEHLQGVWGGRSWMSGEPAWWPALTGVPPVPLFWLQGDGEGAGPPSQAGAECRDPYNTPLPQDDLAPFTPAPQPRLPEALGFRAPEAKPGRRLPPGALLLVWCRAPA